MNVHVSAIRAKLYQSFLCVSLPCMKVIIIVVRLENDFPSFLNISFGDEPYNLSK